jgi:1-acyl-sn-glycerol-3-phosphate acyltransferase
VWWQIAKLGAVSSAGRIRTGLRRSVEAAYGCRALALFGVILLPAWLLVLLSPSRKVAARITTTALRIYIRFAGWSVRVAGRENIRENVPRMFVANHCSYTDLVVLIAAIGTDYHFVAKEEVRSMPFFRTFLRKLGHFAFKREDPHARLEQADEIEQALRRGESVFVFPEGTFTAQPGVRPFHLGAFKAAIAAGREIVPVALNGTRRLLRDGTWLPRRSRVTITICPPIVAQSDASNWQEIVRVRDAARDVISHFAKEPLL